MTGHTLTPWELGGGDGENGAILARSADHCIRIADICGAMTNPDIAADAAFIVKAVNAHEALVQFAEFIRDGYERCDISHVEYRVQAYRAAIDVLESVEPASAVSSADGRSVGGEK